MVLLRERLKYINMRDLIILILLFIQLISYGQSVDKIEAQIGGEILLTSDIETQYFQYLSQNIISNENLKCEVVEELLLQKLLIHHAKLDSIVVKNEDIEEEIEKRINFFINQLGSIEKVEKYFKKSKSDIEFELSKTINDQFLAQKKQQEILTNINITPYEVNKYFLSLDTSEIPLIPTQLRVSKLVVQPKIRDDQKSDIRSRLNGFRESVYNGDDFKVLAALYSDDPGSAAKGGELGFVSRGDLVPEFERAAFRLKKGEISEVVESQFGFHIIQLIERRGTQINVRHILLKPKLKSAELLSAKTTIDSVNILLKNGSDFDEIVDKYSDAENDVLINPRTNSSLYSIDDMPVNLQAILKNLNEGDYSAPNLLKLDFEQKSYVIFRIDKKINNHKANLIDDYNLLKEMALNDKKTKLMNKWITENIKETYIKFSNNTKLCDLKNKWF